MRVVVAVGLVLCIQAARGEDQSSVRCAGLPCYDCACQEHCFMCTVNNGTAPECIVNVLKDTCTTPIVDDLVAQYEQCEFTEPSCGWFQDGPTCEQSGSLYGFVAFLLVTIVTALVGFLWADIPWLHMDFGTSKSKYIRKLGWHWPMASMPRLFRGKEGAKEPLKVPPKVRKTMMLVLALEVLSVSCLFFAHDAPWGDIPAFQTIGQALMLDMPAIPILVRVTVPFGLLVVFVVAIKWKFNGVWQLPTQIFESFLITTVLYAPSTTYRCSYQTCRGFISDVDDEICFLEGDFQTQVQGATGGYQVKTALAILMFILSSWVWLYFKAWSERHDCTYYADTPMWSFLRVIMKMLMVASSIAGANAGASGPLVFYIVSMVCMIVLAIISKVGRVNVSDHVNNWRVLTYSMCAWPALGSLLGVVLNNGMMALIITFGGWVLLFVVGVILLRRAKYTVGGLRLVCEERSKRTRIKRAEAKLRQKAQRERDKKKLAEAKEVVGGSGTAKKKWMVDMADITLGKVVGKGGYGEVFKGTWRGSEVAVKKLLKKRMNKKAMREFVGEVDLMSKLRHPNVVLFMGANVEGENAVMLTEFCERGSLYDVLHSKRIDLDWGRIVRLQNYVVRKGTQLKIALGTTRGMNYLHTAKPPMIHRDLKSLNVLIGANWDIKVADFGLTKETHDEDEEEEEQAADMAQAGTPQWMAPEVLKNEVYDLSADVYSFGIMLWELFTREVPYKGTAPFDVARGVLMRGMRPPIPNNCPPKLAALMQACWATAPEDRPTFGKIIELLKDIQGDGIPEAFKRRDPYHSI